MKFIRLSILYKITNRNCALHSRIYEIKNVRVLSFRKTCSQTETETETESRVP